MAARELADPFAAYDDTRRRLLWSLLGLVAVMGGGAAGYWYLGWLAWPGHWDFFSCLYMTAITVTTVGYGETLDLDSVAGAREWTLVLLVFGISVNLYVVSSITSFFVESDFADARRYRRTRKRMEQISGHYIVCGAGRTGIHVVRELLAVGESIVVVDANAALLDELRHEEILCVTGDATDDEVLERAGIRRAKGIVAALDDDKTNMFVVVSARQTNPDLRIVTKAVATTAAEKLRRAGADAVVSPAFIGGMRLVSEMVRPHVVRFLDEMLRDRTANLRIEEANIGQDAPLVGKKLRDARIREVSGALVIAVRAPDGSVTHVPSPDLELRSGITLVAIGRPEEIARLRESVGHVAAGRSPPATTSTTRAPASRQSSA